MEQTATTQLYLKLQQIEFYYQQGDLTITEFIEAKKEAFSQAEETFKLQIMKAHLFGAINYQGGENNFNHFQENNHYYNEQYGKSSNN